MIQNTQEVINAIFTTLIVAVGVSVGLKQVYGSYSKEWRDNFVSIMLGYLVLVEYYHLSFACFKVPSTYTSSLGAAYRYECLKSTKGGKRSISSTSSTYENPCYCNNGATCLNTDTGTVLPAASCPTNDPENILCAYYYDNNINNEVEEYIDVYLNEKRDCEYAKGPSCSKDEPCTPCQLEKLEEFGASRCVTCGLNGINGQCDFIPNVGPYCWKDTTRTTYEPCTQCCTELSFNTSTAVGSNTYVLPYRYTESTNRCIS